MPKLLSEYPGAGYLFSSDAITRNPELAALIGVVANSWTGLELQLGRTLAHFLHTQPEIGGAIYGSITSVQMKQQIVAQAARAATPQLTETENQVLGVLLTTLRQLYERRIIIEHGRWGFSPQVPDALLRVRPRDFLAYDIAIQQHLTTALSTLRRPPTDPAPFDLGLIEVHHKDYFTNLITEMDELTACLSAFQIWTDPLWQQAARDVMHRRLCTVPRIREILSPTPTAPRNRPAKRKQSPPKDQS